MAHDFLKAETLVNASLGLVEREVVLPNIVWRDAEAHYQGNVGPRGDEVIVRVPGKLTEARELEWRDPTRKIITDDIKEGSMRIKLDTYLYKAVQLLREEQTLDIAEFGGQVLQPMATSVAEGAEDRIATAIKGADYTGDGQTIEVGTGDRGVYNALIDANKFLNRNGVPRQGRVAVLGSEMEAMALKDPTLVDVNRSGSTGALREAQLGRIAGNDLFGHDVIDPDAIYLFHPTAFPTVFRAPAPARSVPFSASMASAGIAMSYWESLNSDNDSDRAFLGTFFGVGVHEDPVDLTDPAGATKFIRGVKLTLPGTP